VTDPVPDLFPRPRSLRVLDPAVRVAGPVRAAADPTLPAQGYDLVVDASGARLTHADDAGRRYGEQTVGRLRGEDGALPAVHVRDWPDLPVRAYMLDISRDRVPTRETLARLVDVLATCRYNQLQVYVEHTFAYRDHELVWRDASPITPDDLRWLDAVCAAAGIELVGNQNCFGHLAPWLRHDAYRSRAECPDGYVVGDGVRMPPSVLAPTQANADFVVGLVREQMAALTSPRFNVGCDETFELGKGASRALVEREGATVVYAEHLRRIVEPLLADGCSLQHWGDIIAHDPSALERLPAGDLTALVWNYEAPDAPCVEVADATRSVFADLGIDPDADTAFAGRLVPFVESGRPFWVAPGTSSWNSIVGRLDNAVSNLADAAAAAVDANAGGYLVTDWGDGGHHQPLWVSYQPLAYGGAVSWCLATNRDVDLAAVVDRHLVGDEAGVLGGVLTAIGGVAARTGMVGQNTSPLLVGLFPGSFQNVSGSPDPDALADVLDTLARARSDLDAVRPTLVDRDLLVDELGVTVELAHFAAETLAGSAGSPVRPAAERAAHLASLIERFRAAWLTTSRPGGLDHSAGRLDRTRRSLDRRSVDS